MADSDENSGLDIGKMKVADLKKELKARGMSIGGNKTELMERLQAALNGDGALILEADSVVADTEEILDEDEVLADEEVLEDEIADISGKTNENDIISDLTVSESKRKLDDVDVDVDEPAPKLPPAKKIILNRAVVSQTEEETHHEYENDASRDVTAKTVIKLSGYSSKERMEMRAKKFGVPLTADARKEARTLRFGGKDPISGNVVEDSEKLKKRQERFGAVQTNPITKISTGKISTRSPSLDEKKKQRAERFKLNK